MSRLGRKSPKWKMASKAYMNVAILHDKKIGMIFSCKGCRAFLSPGWTIAALPEIKLDEIYEALQGCTSHDEYLLLLILSR